MKILLTGATGYIGKRLLPVLLEQGHKVICCVRDRSRFELKQHWENVKVFEVDFAEPVDLSTAPLDFDIAYYLIHSMSTSIGDFEDLEALTARHFSEYTERSDCRHNIYLTGIVNHAELSAHLESRLRVENILKSGRVPLTALRAGIIVGSGSASFEIVRDLVEKLPVMITPKWVNSRCQPVAIRNVIQFLTQVQLREDCMGQHYDIGCADIVSYRDMLMGYARARKLNRWILTVPVMTPRLSSYWLYFITSTSYKLSVNLVDSMKIDVICAPNDLAQRLGIELIPYQTAVEMAFEKIEQNLVVSSWKDALSSSYHGGNLTEYVEIPKHGCFVDQREHTIRPEHLEEVLDNLWSIGGNRGWYYADWLWRMRGFVDKLLGGVGLRRGRTHPDHNYPGDALDFWRVLVADKKKMRLLLYAEMKLPGEAWLEFRIDHNKGNPRICQTATFRPDGLSGRLYWYAVQPFHFFIFEGMLRNIVRFRRK